MKNCQVVNIQTPKKFLLNGLWFGPDKAETVLVWVHGLSSNAFSHSLLIELIADKNTAVLNFSNRGSGLVTGFKRLNPNKPKGREYRVMGMAHEVFTDCRDDLDGAIDLAVSRGAKRVFLVGHSTGCQKSVYYLAHKPHPKVSGVVLLAPVSDYAGMIRDIDPVKYRRLVVAAQKLVAIGKPHELMPAKFWPETIDAQRFLSLYTPNSQEEIFSYASNKRPVTLNKVKVPILAVLAALDDYLDRPIGDLVSWFKTALEKQQARVETVQGVGHSFDGAFPAVAKLVKGWIVNKRNT